MEVLRGEFVKSIFFDQATGFSVFLFKPEAKDGENAEKIPLVRVRGKFCLTGCPHMPLFLKGKRSPEEYGGEFQAEEVRETVISEKNSANFVAGLGIINRKEAAILIKAVGADIFSAVYEDEEKLLSVKGVDLASTMAVFAKIRELKNEMDTFNMLSKYGASYEHVKKITKKYPETAVAMLFTNAYKLLEETGVPFSVIDRFSLENGADEMSEGRVQAILLWAIRKEASAGHTFMTIEAMAKTISKTYGEIPMSTITSCLQDHPYIKKDRMYPEAYYEARTLADEKQAAKEFARIMKSRVNLSFHPEFIDQIEKENGRRLGNQQREAFSKLLLTTGVKLLTGDPGTGKTTTLNAILKYCEMLWEQELGHKPKMALCAPAGRAAQRMKETTGRNALTIHKLLEYQPYGMQESFKDADDPIDADIVVVDESSMMGLSIFAKLLGAIQNGSLVILIGDTNQLQSVDQGDVLHDIIKTAMIDFCHLTEVFRQAETSLINQNAKMIINGAENLKTGADFGIIQCDPEQTETVLRDQIEEFQKECGDNNKIQVLAPMRKGTCGVKNSNKLVQQMFNPKKGGIWYGFHNFKVGDRVMTMSNNYSLNYFNGDVGYIVDISEASMEVKINGEVISLPKENWEDLDLAYCCTIHKSQGSEYDFLAIVLQEEAAGMLDRNLLYTAVTRGKQKVVVIYEKDSLRKSIRTKKQGQRRSLLTKRILEEMKK